MPRRRTVVALAVVGILALALVVLEFGLWLALVDPGEYDRGQVVVEDPTGERLETVDVRFADNPTKRTIGLGRTDELADDEGMLFVHDEEERHRYVMRGMDFSLDVVFVAGNGTITAIRHADPASPLTPESLMERYAGEGKYVLEVNRGWTNESDVDVGDRVRLEEGLDDVGLERPSPSATPTPEPTQTATDRRPTVRALDENGTELGRVRVEIADNSSEREIGLSETASLPEGEGMLFVYDDEDLQRFWMPNMSFPLDIVFVGANETVTEIHHASVPPPGTDEDELRRYPGTGQYVLEVNRGWTNETGLDEGDTVNVPDGY